MESDPSAEFYTLSLEGLQRGDQTVRLVLRDGMISIMPGASRRSFDLEQTFRSLAAQWRQDTKHISNVNKAMIHPAYQQIIGMGKAMPGEVTSLLLHELERELDHWFVALVEVTGTDAGSGQDTVSGAARCWLEWGRREGYLINARSSA